MLYETAIVLFLMCVGSHGTSVFRTHLLSSDGFTTSARSRPLILGTSEWLFEYDRENRTMIMAYVPKMDRLQIAHAIIQGELKIYPDAFLQLSQLNQIVCCENLLHGPMLASASVGGVANGKLGTILLNINTHRYYLRHATHHELFHILDSSMGFDVNDSEWLSLNDPAFRYARRKSSPGSKHTGFATEYAMTAMCEDKADTFARLVLEHDEILLQAKDDVVLSRKIACIKSRLRSFCPEINSAFWLAVERRIPPVDDALFIEHREPVPLSFAMIPNEHIPGIGANIQSWSNINQTPPKVIPPEPMSDVAKIGIFLGVMLSPYLLIMLAGFVTKKQVA